MCVCVCVAREPGNEASGAVTTFGNMESDLSAIMQLGCLWGVLIGDNCSHIEMGWPTAIHYHLAEGLCASAISV